MHQEGPVAQPQLVEPRHLGVGAGVGQHLVDQGLQGIGVQRRAVRPVEELGAGRRSPQHVGQSGDQLVVGEEPLRGAELGSVHELGAREQSADDHAHAHCGVVRRARQVDRAVHQSVDFARGERAPPQPLPQSLGELGEARPIAGLLRFAGAEGADQLGVGRDIAGYRERQGLQPIHEHLTGDLGRVQGVEHLHLGPNGGVHREIGVRGQVLHGRPGHPEHVEQCGIDLTPAQPGNRGRPRGRVAGTSPARRLPTTTTKSRGPPIRRPTPRPTV